MRLKTPDIFCCQSSNLRLRGGLHKAYKALLFATSQDVQKQFTNRIFFIGCPASRAVFWYNKRESLPFVGSLSPAISARSRYNHSTQYFLTGRGTGNQNLSFIGAGLFFYQFIQLGAEFLRHFEGVVRMSGFRHDMQVPVVAVWHDEHPAVIIISVSYTHLRGSL